MYKPLSQLGSREPSRALKRDWPTHGRCGRRQLVTFGHSSGLLPSRVFEPVNTGVLSRCQHKGIKERIHSRRILISPHAASASAGGTASPAFTELMATLTGYCVLIGSIFRSVPQIIRIVKNKSVEGLSLTSFVSELIAYTIIWAYNFNLGYPFSTYGEIVACWIQDIALVGLVLYYKKQINSKVVLYTAAFAVFMGVLMTNTCGSQALYALQASTIAMIALGARVPQIWMNYKRGDSGELSLLTCLMNVSGCFARIFTTLVLTKDTLNLIAGGVQTVLNGVLLYQTVVTYQRSRARASQSEGPDIGPAAVKAA